MSIPQKLIVNFRVVFDVAGIPPEKIQEFKTRDYKTWAEEFKADLEGDPDFGKYCKVTISTEEVI